MKSILRAVSAAAILCGGLCAQGSTPEALTAWPYFKDLNVRAGLNAAPLDGEILDKARTDQSDLRLYDAAGREIPYVLQVRREVDSRSLFTSREFNRAVEGGAAVVSCDLGPQAQEHNEVVVATSGNNFRRLADVQASPDGAQWFTLASQVLLFRFSANGRSAEQQSISYPVSRYRYVRVRVERDAQVDHAPPEITSLGVLRSVRAKGETTSFFGGLESRDAEPMQGRPASVWHIDLQHRVPIQSLALTIGDRTFSRPFQLDSVDDPAAPEPLASGDLHRTDESAAEPAQIDFAEHFARRLRLTIVDDRNPPLSLTGANALSAMRLVLFQSDAAGSLRLYYGNPKAIAPNYDLATRLSAATPQRVTLLSERPNPIYRPEPSPFSERSPWLVYIVLTGACAALAAILLNLARHAKQTVSAS